MNQKVASHFMETIMSGLIQFFSKWVYISLKQLIHDHDIKNMKRAFFQISLEVISLKQHEPKIYQSALTMRLIENLVWSKC